VLVCSRGEVERQKFALETAAVHADIIVFTAECAEHSLELMLYCDMPVGLEIGIIQSHAIPNRSVHAASILKRIPERRTRSRIARRYLGHPTLAGLIAEEEACPRAELAEPPAGVDVLQHRGDQGALQVGAGRERTSLDYRPVNVPHDVTARLVRRLERIEDVAAHARDSTDPAEAESIQ